MLSLHLNLRAALSACMWFSTAYTCHFVYFCTLTLI
jgi:hypothetical protein